MIPIWVSRKQVSLFYLQFLFRFQLFHWSFFNRVLSNYSVRHDEPLLLMKSVWCPSKWLKTGVFNYIACLGHLIFLIVLSYTILCVYLLYVPNKCKNCLNSFPKVLWVRCCLFIHSFSYSFNQLIEHLLFFTSQKN